MKNFINKLYDYSFEIFLMILIFVWLLINSNLYWINEKLKELIKIEKQIINIENQLLNKTLPFKN